ncbi:MAG TPA: hypothetical protein DEB39_15175 [Planctomycetaceae bacterium]|nr:hypothetical protein [Planctomycetaceae bacterium]
MYRGNIVFPLCSVFFGVLCGSLVAEDHKTDAAGSNRNLVALLNDCHAGTTTGSSVEAPAGCPLLHEEPLRQVAWCPGVCGSAGTDVFGKLSVQPSAGFAGIGAAGPECRDCMPVTECVGECDENGLCPCCRRCETHVNLYGHDPQFVCDRPEPKIRLLRPFEIYTGTFGRQAYAGTCGYDCRSRRCRESKPAAYISREYVAALNRAVWEQFDAERSKWAVEAAACDVVNKQAVKEVATGKVVEWSDYLQRMIDEQDRCRIELAEGWLRVSRGAEKQAEQDLRTALRLLKEREEYRDFAIERAKNSEKEAKIASHHRRVFVKPPLDREALRAGLPEVSEVKSQVE